MNSTPQATSLKTKRKIYSGLISVFVIVLTGVLTNYGMCEVCFFLHLIPWGIGFAEGYTLGFFLYYVFLFLALSSIVYLVIKPRDAS